MALLSETGTVADAVRVLEASVAHICLVTDGEGRLKGTITDGDVRRSLLRSLPLSAPARDVMNAAPIVGRPGDDRHALLAALRAAQVRQLPFVDEAGRVVGLETVDELADSGERPNWVVLMAGGLGTRLRPLTDDMPKPMLKVGAKPLLETTIEAFVQQGFRRFFISVNYLADKVKEYFGDGRTWNCDIRYLEEREPLGTAGALKLISTPIEDPVVVMNGDVLTKINFGQLIDYHREHRAAATMCVREYAIEVPYGVVRLDGARILGIDEKPSNRFFVNAGIYVLEPSVLEILPNRECFNMPDLFHRLEQLGQQATAFPLREYWLDIGQMDDYTRAGRDFEAVFERGNS